MMVGQMLAAERDDSAVNVRHERPLDGIVPQRLAYGGAFAAARHEHGARRGMGDHRGVDKPFVIGELVHFGGLRFAVQDEAAPERRAGLDDDVLIRRPPREVDALDALRLIQVGRDHLVMPVSGRRRVHGASLPVSDEGARTPRSIWVMDGRALRNRSTMRSAASRGLKSSLHEKISAAAYANSGQV